MDARQLIDFASDDNAKDFREGLYSAIYDKVNAHIEAKKQEVAHNLVTQESKECECDDESEDKKEGHEDEKEDKAMIKKMVKKDALKTEEVEEIEEASYSAKAARAGKDIGKPGKQFAKIAAGAAKKYGSSEKGEKVAGAVLANLRKEEVEEIEEAVSRKHFQMVADVIKSHDDHEKRKELAQHHATIFAAQNPRFDRSKFMKAANVQE